MCHSHRQAERARDPVRLRVRRAGVMSVVTKRNGHKRPGRPPLPATAKRDHVISFRVSGAELAWLSQRAAQAGRSNLNSFAKDAALNTALTVRHDRLAADRPIDAKAIAALNRLGVNLNQIAKHLNGGKYVHYADIERLIERIDRAMTDLLEP